MRRSEDDADKHAEPSPICIMACLSNTHKQIAVKIDKHSTVAELKAQIMHQIGMQEAARHLQILLGG